MYSQMRYHAPLIIRLLSVFADICYFFSSLPVFMINHMVILAYIPEFVKPLPGKTLIGDRAKHGWGRSKT